MKIFVMGATGFIGFNVAQAFRRAGHEVWGVTRSKEKAKILLQNEIFPVIGNMQNPDSYKKYADECSVLIQAASDNENNQSELDKKTIETFIKSSKESDSKKTIIHTSGCWIYGDTKGKMVDESAPKDPIEMVKWRIENENLVLNSKEVKGIVIRPGCVYGKQGSLYAIWFKEAHLDNDLKVIGDGNNYWANVHVDDLADAYLKAAESNLSGEDFNIADRSRWTVREMAEAAAKVSGYKKDIKYIPVLEAAKNMGGLAEALALNQHLDARKAVRLLGWQPKFGGFVDDIDIYFESWKSYL